jgi:hypothetical protein
MIKLYVTVSLLLGGTFIVVERTNLYEEHVLQLFSKVF